MKLTKYDDRRATAMLKASTTKSSGFDKRGQRKVRRRRPRAVDSARGTATARGPVDSTRAAATGEVEQGRRRSVLSLESRGKKEKMKKKNSHGRADRRRRRTAGSDVHGRRRKKVKKS
ncbi:hypothetical protein LWI29_002844 [Acer saccharum]|uniref:Uncharacterized protein n=1 Tax=Acer saccharum TaxID=4024 RepID=A0AA39T0L3_ACESA|nr:hypothetical protein LWI29_002844 [Acer saccharum]